ncbi:hypothetical protein AB0I77_46530 [Streptomyces sp. NPDC050619]|uniref:hypothetical protein n=1 Tax=Streptomyces sp. NPDC050619 TaxID=3157214 RepID=UPI0034459A14
MTAENNARNAFLAVLAHNDLTVPEDLTQGVFHGFLELRSMVAVLRDAHEAETEPANVFRVPVAATDNEAE